MHNVLDLWVATLAVNPLVPDFRIFLLNPLILEINDGSRVTTNVGASAFLQPKRLQ